MKTKLTPRGLPAILSVLAVIVLAACSALPLSRPQSNIAQPALAAVSVSKPDVNQQAAPTATPQANAPAAAVPQNGLIAAYEGSLESVYASVNPSVVNIHVVESAASSGQGSGRTSPFGNPNQNNTPSAEALGSGFVWDQNGNIVTNNHVVSGASEIDVTFSDGTNVPATMVGTDPDSDLAVIKVSASSDLLHPVGLADSKQVRVGQLAIAIGNPFGLSGSMSVGIVSALQRTMPTSQTTQGGSYTIPDIIQTDAAINPGNSGGVLLNELGQVIGVTNAIESSSNSNSGVGFAIPSQIVQRVIPALIQNGKYAHSWLGISAGDLTPDLAKAMNLPTNQRGALIATITAGSPAEKAGLRASNSTATINGQSVPVGGDVVTAIDGQPVKKIDDLIAYLTENTSVGQKVTLTLLRDGKESQVDVTLAERPAQPQVTQQQQPNPQQPGNGTARGTFLGVNGLNMNADVAQAMNLPANTSGVLIEQVQSGSPADQAGLKAGNKPFQIQGTTIQLGGDIITAINGQAVSSNQALRAALASFNPGDKITVSILRGGQSQEVSVTLAARTN